MTVLKILVAPDPRLKEKAKPVQKVDADVRQLMDDMLETMYEHNGIGLAATQVGIDKRVIVVDVADSRKDEKPDPYQIANPELVETSQEEVASQEGCFSVPGYFADVVRPATCTIKGLDRNNNEITIKADGLLGVCLQHEIDHLDGILFVDHLTRLKRKLILQRLGKDIKLGRAHQYGRVI